VSAGPVPPDTPGDLRARAEAALLKKAAQSAIDLTAMTPQEAQGLLHELQVHQIELDLQNEALRASHLALEQSRERFFDLYDLAPVGYCSVTESGLLLHANLTLATLLGVTRGALSRQPAFAHFILQEDQDQWYQLRKQLLQDAAPRSTELRLRRDDPVWVQLNASVAPEPSGPPVLRLTLTNISQLKEAQTRQLESEARWKFALEGAGEGLWDWNVQTGRAFFSTHYKTMLGYDEADIGTSADEWKSRIHPDDAPGVMAAMQPYMDGKPGTATVEFRMRRKDGQWQWVLGRGMVVERTSQGKPLRMIGTNTDLTERKNTEEALRLSEARFRALLQDVPLVAVQGYGADGTTHYWNDASERLYGFSATEAVGRSLLETIIPEEMHQGVRLAMQEMFATGKAIPAGELSLRRKDGTRVDVFSSHVYVHVPGNAPEMFCVDIDLSERKEAEAKLELAASVFSSAREGIMITDALGTIVEVNEAFSRITGYSREEALGKNPHFMSSGRQSRGFYAEMWITLAAQGHWSGEIWNRRKDGEVYAEQLTISAVDNPHGATQQYVALFSDITALKNYQSQLEHMAHYDALTHLPNRLLLADRLQQAMVQAQRRGLQVAVVYLDLDGFKDINDHYGHAAGDHVLVQLTQAMQAALREGDTLARIGGDEFVAVLIDLESTESYIPLVQRLLAAAAAPVPWGEQVLQVSASAGLAHYPQTEDPAADQLLRQADQAMYEAKTAGKNCYRVFRA